MEAFRDYMYIYDNATVVMYLLSVNSGGPYYLFKRNHEAVPCNKHHG
jgi:hypothetical protein